MTLKTKIKLLFVDDDSMYRDIYTSILSQYPYTVQTAKNGGEGLVKLQESPFDLIFVDYRMPDMNGLEFLKRVLRVQPNSLIVLITAYAQISTAVEAIKLGAIDYLEKPFEKDKLLECIQEYINRDENIEDDVAAIDFQGEQLDIITKSPNMLDVLRMTKKIAPTDSTVLLQGESGTGKELIAKAIHASSLLSANPFFAMDCGSLVESLFESELFGHVKGSFTGAIATKHGAFELAHGGTFFFDEIGNISLNLQAKILRAIQEKEIRRVGSNTTIPVDVRVIAATNRDLQQAVENKEFRDDLYYRLSVIPITIPPLRERKQDIPLLVDYFIKLFSKKSGDRIVTSISPQALDLLTYHDWPGNIRELRNSIERAVLIEESDTIQPESLPITLRTLKKSRENGLISLSEVEKTGSEPDPTAAPS